MGASKLSGTVSLRMAFASASAAGLVSALLVIPAATAGAAIANPARPCTNNKTIKAKVHKIGVAWLPTNWSSAFVAGPADISKTVMVSSAVQWTISASFSLDEGLIFASAKEQYGISLARTTTHSKSVTYTLIVPAGKTAKMQEFHQGYEMGITQWYLKCTSQGYKEEKETSPSGNYIPVKSNADDSYCYAAVSYENARIETKHLYHGLCVPQW